MNAGSGEIIDHINRNTLNCCFYNLRKCTQSQNHCNHKLDRRNKSGASNVSWDNREHAWRIQLQYNGKRISGGYYKDKDTAINKAIELRNQYYDNFSHKK
jgi:hypothetical protein